MGHGHVGEVFIASSQLTRRTCGCEDVMGSANCLSHADEQRPDHPDSDTSSASR